MSKTVKNTRYINISINEAAISADMAILKAQIKSREDYIKKMHKSMKSIDKGIQLLYIASVINKKVAMPYKRIFCLEYLYRSPLARISNIQNHLDRYGVRPAFNKTDIDALLKGGYILKDKDYFYATQKGKEFVIGIYTLLKDTMKFFSSAKKVRNLVTAEKKKRKESSFDRKAYYSKMMAPFWGVGIKKIPKDKHERILILSDYIKKNGDEDNFYINFIHKWGV